MRVYTGHQIEDRRGAFFVFAKSKQQAIDFLAGEDIEVDEASLKLVKAPGAMLFRTAGARRPPEPEGVCFEGELPDWSARP